jgi:flagellar biogenesis protein FliO
MSSRHLLALLLTLSSARGLAATVKAPQSSNPALDEDTADDASTKRKKNAVAKSSATSLGAISTDVEADLTVVTVRLNNKPQWSDVTLEEHGTFLQIKLPKTQIPASGEFIDGNGPYLKKIATFQLQDDDGALRFFLSLDAAKAKMATSAELLGDRLVITIDHKKIEQLLAPQSAKSEATTADEIVAKTVVDKSVPAPSDQITAAKESDTKNSDVASNDSPNSELYARLAKAAAFCAVMFMGLIGYQVARSRRVRGSSPFRGKAEANPVAMKVLSSINIGQKQKLTLVQVGNQQILLGVGPESVNLITTIEQPSSAPRNFSMALESANPQGTVRLKSADEIVPQKTARRVATPTIQSKPENQVKGSRVNVSVGDDGIRESAPVSKTDDITKMLRERLRNLPPR